MPLRGLVYRNVPGEATSSTASHGGPSSPEASDRAGARSRRALGLIVLGTALASIILVIGCLVANRGDDGPPPQPPQRLMHSLHAVNDGIGDDRFGSQQLKPTGPYDTPLIAHRFDSWAYAKMDSRSLRLGSVRQGRVVWGKPERSGGGCDERWYELAQGGYACPSGSFRVVESGDAEQSGLEPALDSALPYAYVQVTTDGAPRYDRIPTPDEEVAAWAGKARGVPLDVRMVGDYFLAVVAEEKHRGRRFYRTLRNKFVRVEDVTAPAPSTLQGTKAPALPLAFVIDESTPTFKLGNGEVETVETVGTATRYARFVVAREVARGEERYVVGGDGLAVRAESVRVATVRARPAGVAEREKWIHVNLSEQVMVAYEGDTPVFATLVSSGKPGHETPTGAFRVQHKHISTTMRGRDPVDGRYEVEEVPWTMYYDGSYALHGAYWHDQFGRVRSHGCTNLAPADARWLLRWTEPELPTGWHSTRARSGNAGTQVYITE